jgi:hypothetical protein
MELLEKRVAEWGKRLTEVRVEIHFAVEKARGELKELRQKLPSLLAARAMGERDISAVLDTKKRIADLEETIADLELVPPELDRKHQRWMGASSLVQGIKRDLEKIAELEAKLAETADPRRQEDIHNLQSWMGARKAQIAQLIPEYSLNDRQG